MKVKVDMQRLRDKVRRLDEQESRACKEVIKRYGERAYTEVKSLLNRPVSKRAGNFIQRSRPGQPPRTDSGRMSRSIQLKFSPKGWRGTVTTTDVAQDKKGRRYPWMNESGSQYVKKRPLFARVKRKLVRPYRRDLALAVFGVARRVDRS